MLVIFHVLSSLLFVFFAGFGITGFFINSLPVLERKNYSLIVLSIGYIVSQVLFLQFYTIYENHLLSFYLTILSVTVINAVYLILMMRKRKFTEILIELLPNKKDYKIIFVLLAIFVLSSWQYILIGEGHYYHSGNEDFFDGVNGGALYLLNTPVENIFWDGFQNVRFQAIIRYQYSSQAFWRLLLGINGIDAFLIQSVFNLLLANMGVYWLTLYVFEASKKAALLASLFCIVSSFYFSTYMTGHIGSMMYVSIIPFLLGLFLLFVKKKIKFYWLLLISLLYYFIDNTYPGPIYFLIFPAILLFINERILTPQHFWKWLLNFLGIEFSDSNRILFKQKSTIKTASLVAFIILFTGIVSIYLWDYFELRRVTSLLRLNESWKITLFKEMLMVFWGLYPSGSTGTMSVLPLIISNGTLNTLSFFVAILLSTFTFYAAIKISKQKKYHFLLLNIILFVPYFIIMRYFWGSPYYLYKFLYVHYFLITLPLFIWFSEFLFNLKKSFYVSILIFFIVLGTLNITWDLALGHDFYRRAYNDKERITDFFSNVPKEKIEKSTIDIPNEIYNLVFRTILAERNLSIINEREKADYIIQFNGIGNATYNSLIQAKTVYDNGVLNIREHSKENDLTVATNFYYEPFNIDSININWVGNSISFVNHILKDDISLLTDYMSKAKLEFLPYLNLIDDDIYQLVHNSFSNRNIKLNYNYNKAKIVIQMRMKPEPFIINENEQVLWKSTFFVVKSRSVIESFEESKIFNDKKKIQHFINYIIENGNSVFLISPPSEFLYWELKKYFSLFGIRVINKIHETSLFINFKGADSPESINKTELTLNKITDGRVVPIVQEIPLSIPLSALNIIKGDFQISISNPTKDAKYIRVLLQPGPSIDFKDFELNVYKGLDIIDKKKIEMPKTLIDFDLDKYISSDRKRVDISLEGEGLVGNSLLPIDDRYLNYQVQAVELTNSLDSYSSNMLKALNLKPRNRIESFLEILGRKIEFKDIFYAKNDSGIFLGLGWFNFEEFNNQGFRWVGKNPAEIIINNQNIANKILNISLESGPACGDNPLELDLFFNGELLKKEKFRGKNILQIDFSKIRADQIKEQNILKLIPISQNIKTPTDPRILNFRVFDIRFISNN